MLASFSVVPYGVGESLSKHVAEVIRIVHDSGLAYRTNAMSTEIEGPFDQVMDVIARCHKAMLAVSPRVITEVKIDDRPSREGTMLEGKVDNVESILGHKARRDQSS